MKNASETRTAGNDRLRIIERDSVKGCALWTLEVWSDATQRWIVQGEHRTKEQALEEHGKLVNKTSRQGGTQ